MKKIFIDCGGWNGQTVRWVKKNMVCDEIHSFEPNSHMWQYFDGLPTILHKEAAWTYDGMIDFFLAEKEGGSTVVQGKKTAHVHYEKPISVPCIDLGKWIMRTFSKMDYIILKLNVEGAEYKILKSMVEDGSIQWLSELYVQFHKRKIANISQIHTEVVALVSPFIEIKFWDVMKLEP